MLGSGFLYQWTREEYECHRRARTPSMRRAGSSLFKARGVEKGDLLYVVACVDGDVYLMGRLEVNAILDPFAMAERFKRPKDYFEHHKEWAVCAKGEAGYMYFDLVIPIEVVKRLEMASGSFPLVHEKDGKVVPKGQTLRTLRELSPGAVELLEEIRVKHEATLPD